MKRLSYCIYLVIALLLASFLCACGSSSGYSSINDLINAYVSGVKSGNIEEIEKCFYPSMVSNYSLNAIDSRSNLYGKWEEDMKEYDINTFYTIDKQYPADSRDVIIIRHELKDAEIENVTVIKFYNAWYGFEGSNYYENGLIDCWYIIKTNEGYFIFCDCKSDYADNHDMHE